MNHTDIKCCMNCQYRTGMFCRLHEFTLQKPNIETCEDVSLTKVEEDKFHMYVEGLHKENTELKAKLTQAAQRISKLEEDNTNMGWELNPDRMGS